MLAEIEYYTFDNGKELHYAEVDLEREEEYYDTPEGTAELNKMVSKATGLPVGSFKIGNFL